MTVKGLPMFVALDATGVLGGARRGTSVQLDGTYFAGQAEAARVFGESDDRGSIASQSLREYEAIDVKVEGVSEEDLWEASEDFRGSLMSLPEIKALKQEFPETCFVVPEWLRSEERVHYGARIYFFPDNDAPTPEEVIRHNVEAVAADEFGEFEKYQGKIHGYPECCVEYYRNEERGEGFSPEAVSVESLTDRLNEKALGGSSIRDALPNLLEEEAAYGYFTREFFPEPECDQAIEKGQDVYTALTDEFPEAAVHDYFRLNYGYCYLVARRVEGGSERRPRPGALGKEHLASYLPAEVALDLLYS